MDRNTELIERLRGGDLDARETLVKENMGLVYAIARRFEGRGCAYEDLVQIGSIGLLKAAKRFDASFDVKFSTYAVPLIQGEIRRFFRDDGMIKISRVVKEHGVVIRRYMEEHMRKSGEEPTLLDICQGTGLSQEEVTMAMDAFVYVESLQAPLYEEEGREVCLGDTIKSSASCEENAINRIMIASLMELLDEKQRRIIILRYYENKTQSQVAQMLGMTQVAVSRAEKKILLLFREKVGNDNL